MSRSTQVASLVRVGFCTLVALAVASWSASSQLAAQDVAPATLPSPESILVGNFATSPECAVCHSNSPKAPQALRDSKGRGIAPFDLWRSSMMANSTRDPLWRAVVSMEVAATPSAKAIIEAKCLRCHAPMATTEAAFQGKGPIGLDLLKKESPLAQLALDGVSCTACHQIRPENLGTPESYSGHYEIRKEKQIYGPHAEPAPMPMAGFTGFTPVEAQHMRTSALCGTCHTLFTAARSPDGKPTGEVLPEQTPYLEWRNSVFNDELEDVDHRAASCQDCHMPLVDVDGERIETKIARNPMGGEFRIQPRSPFGRHVFVGGNTLIPAILRDNALALQPGAPKEAFDATIALAREQLSRHSARVWIGDVKQTKRGISIPVRVENLTGHKFPTAHPTRRAWLRVRVSDASGRVLFASGEHDASGRILGADAKPLPTEAVGAGTQPHRSVVRSASEVQVYEAVMSDAAGDPTYLLIRGGHFLKDNRLLPLGWRKGHPDAKSTTPQGVDDETFIPGFDTVTYEVALPNATSALRVDVTVLYQTLGARYAAEILAYTTPEVNEFRGYYAKADKTPETIATASAAVEAR